MSTTCLGLPLWLSGKEFACQYRRHGFDPWVRKISWRRKWQLAPVFLLGKSHGQRSLMGYSPRSLKSVRHNLVTKTQVLGFYSLLGMRQQKFYFVSLLCRFICAAICFKSIENRTKISDLYQWLLCLFTLDTWMSWRIEAENSVSMLL